MVLSCIALSCGTPPITIDASVRAPADRTLSTMGTTMMSGCIIDGQARVQCWGTLARRPYATAKPRFIVLRRPAQSVVAAQHWNEFACALDKAGDVFCWGSGTRGELGEGVVIYTTQPRRIPLQRPAHAIAAVQSRACALLDDGGVTCWGNVLPGPTEVHAIRREDGRRLTGLVQIDVDVGVDESGRVWVWGDDRCAEVRHADDANPASGSPALYAMPARVKRGMRAVQVASMGYTSCALDEAGGVECWGESESGAIDQLACEHCTAVPWRVDGLPPVASLRCGQSECAALDRAGRVHLFSTFGAPQMIVALSGMEAVEADVASWAYPQGCVRLAGSRELRCFGVFVGTKEETLTLPPPEPE